jgi:hypothetical protein
VCTLFDDVVLVLSECLGVFSFLGVGEAFQLFVALSNTIEHHISLLSSILSLLFFGSCFDLQ